MNGNEMNMDGKKPISLEELKNYIEGESTYKNGKIEVLAGVNKVAKTPKDVQSILKGNYENGKQRVLFTTDNPAARADFSDFSGGYDVLTARGLIETKQQMKDNYPVGIICVINADNPVYIGNMVGMINEGKWNGLGKYKDRELQILEVLV